MKRHNHVIDLLRFLASLMVVLFHLNLGLYESKNWYIDIVKYGWLGVPVFFVISGFCIMQAAEHAHTSKTFFIRRFFRIYPAYWVSLIVVLLAAVFQKTLTGTNSVAHLPDSIISFLANITLATWPLTKIDTINYVYWSLTCELFFYFVIGISLLFKTYQSVVFLMIISLLSVFLPRQFTGLLFFFDSWPAFGCGISLYYFLNRSKKDGQNLWWVLTVINFYGLAEKFMVNNEMAYCAVTLVATAIIGGSNYIETKPNFFSKLGEYAYSVYLIHVPVGVFMLGRLKVLYNQQHPLLIVLYDLCIYTVISLVARQIFKMVEKPAITYGKNFSEKYIPSKNPSKIDTVTN